MGARQSKRSVDISGTPKKGELENGAVEEGGRLERLEEGDVTPVTVTAKATQNGTADHGPAQAPPVTEGAQPVLNGASNAEPEDKKEEAEESKTEEKLDESLVNGTAESPESKDKSTDEAAATPEKDKKKKEKSKKKWSFRSISFSRKDKSKPNVSKDDSKNGSVTKEETVPEVVEAEAAATTEAIPIKDDEAKKEEAPVSAEEKDEKKEGTSTETPTVEASSPAPAPAPVEPTTSPAPTPVEPAPAPAPVPEPVSTPPPAPEPVQEPVVVAAPAPVEEATPEPVVEKVNTDSHPSANDNTLITFALTPSALLDSALVESASVGKVTNASANPDPSCLNHTDLLEKLPDVMEEHKDNKVITDSQLIASEQNHSEECGIKSSPKVEATTESIVERVITNSQNIATEENEGERVVDTKNDKEVSCPTHIPEVELEALPVNATEPVMECDIKELNSQEDSHTSLVQEPELAKSAEEPVANTVTENKSIIYEDVHASKLASAEPALESLGESIVTSEITQSCKAEDDPPTFIMKDLEKALCEVENTLKPTENISTDIPQTNEKENLTPTIVPVTDMEASHSFEILPESVNDKVASHSVPHDEVVSNLETQYVIKISYEIENSQERDSHRIITDSHSCDQDEMKTLIHEQPDKNTFNLSIADSDVADKTSKPNSLESHEDLSTCNSVPESAMKSLDLEIPLECDEIVNTDSAQPNADEVPPTGRSTMLEVQEHLDSSSEFEILPEPVVNKIIIESCETYLNEVRHTTLAPEPVLESLPMSVVEIVSNPPQPCNNEETTSSGLPQSVENIPEPYTNIPPNTSDFTITSLTPEQFLEMIIGEEELIDSSQSCDNQEHPSIINLVPEPIIQTSPVAEAAPEPIVDKVIIDSHTYKDDVVPFSKQLESTRDKSPTNSNVFGSLDLKVINSVYPCDDKLMQSTPVAEIGMSPEQFQNVIDDSQSCDDELTLSNLINNQDGESASKDFVISGNVYEMEITDSHCFHEKEPCSSPAIVLEKELIPVNELIDDKNLQLCKVDASLSATESVCDDESTHNIKIIHDFDSSCPVQSLMNVLPESNIFLETIDTEVISDCQVQSCANEVPLSTLNSESNEEELPEGEFIPEKIDMEIISDGQVQLSANELPCSTFKLESKEELLPEGEFVPETIDTGSISDFQDQSRSNVVPHSTVVPESSEKLLPEGEFVPGTIDTGSISDFQDQSRTNVLPHSTVVPESSEKLLPEGEFVPGTIDTGSISDAQDQSRTNVLPHSTVVPESNEEVLPEGEFVPGTIDTGSISDFQDQSRTNVLPHSTVVPESSEKLLPEGEFVPGTIDTGSISDAQDQSRTNVLPHSTVVPESSEEVLPEGEFVPETIDTGSISDFQDQSRTNVLPHSTVVPESSEKLLPEGEFVPGTIDTGSISDFQDQSRTNVLPHSTVVPESSEKLLPEGEFVPGTIDTGSISDAQDQSRTNVLPHSTFVPESSEKLLPEGEFDPGTIDTGSLSDAQDQSRTNVLPHSTFVPESSEKLLPEGEFVPGTIDTGSISDFQDQSRTNVLPHSTVVPESNEELLPEGEFDPGTIDSDVIPDGQLQSCSNELLLSTFKPESNEEELPEGEFIPEKIDTEIISDSQLCNNEEIITAFAPKTKEEFTESKVVPEPVDTEVITDHQFQCGSYNGPKATFGSESNAVLLRQRKAATHPNDTKVEEVVIPEPTPEPEPVSEVVPKSEDKPEELPPPLPASPPPTEAPPPTPVAPTPAPVPEPVEQEVAHAEPETHEIEVVGGGGESMADLVEDVPISDTEEKEEIPAPEPLVNGVSDHSHDFEKDICEKVEIVADNFKNIVTDSIISTQVTETSEDKSEQTASAAD